MSTSKRTRIPSYRLHRATGQAVVTLEGRDHYLGVYDSPASRDKYDRLVAIYLASGRTVPAELVGGKKEAEASEAPRGGFTVAQLCDAFLDHCEEEYRLPDGTLSREVENVRLALRGILGLFSKLPARAFGPKALREYQRSQVEQGLARKTVNQRVGIVRRAFRWACSEEHIPGEVFHALQAVEGLKRGRSGARESEGVRPAPEEHIHAALPHMPPPVRAMVQLQLLTGMRPGEVLILRACDIDRSGEVWLYEPTRHKNSWRGHKRTVHLGPQAQAILRPFLIQGNEEKFAFSPTRAELRRWQALRRARKTPLWQCHLKRQAAKKAKRTRRKLRDHYDTTTYAQAVRRACTKAKVAIWTPGQLRHNAATRFRSEAGLDAAKTLLGHRLVETTQIYAEKDLALAAEVAKQVG